MVFEKIAAIIAEKLEIPVEKIHENSNFDDLDVDSLLIVEIMLAIEDEFEITIDDAESIEKVADIVAYVEERIE